MTLASDGKHRSFHYVPGLTTPEYDEIKGCLRDPASAWPWLSHGEFLEVAKAALFYRGLYPKALRFARLLARSIPRARLGSAGSRRAMDALVQFESRNLYLMRDSPAAGQKAWRRNKARYAKWMDDTIVEIIRLSVSTVPAPLEAMVRRIEARWASKRLPGVDRRLKPGPKTGKRKRHQKRKEEKTR